MLIVVVNKHRVRANLHKPAAEREPVLRISKGKHGKPRYANSVDIAGPARLVYDVENPLPCGATVWLEIGGKNEL